MGAAIVQDGRVLAAQRVNPPEVAGQWEFPGGKVEPGETTEAALVREIHEELACDIRFVSWLSPDSPITKGRTLRVAHCELVAGTPRPTDPDVHHAARWVSPVEVDEVDWLDSDLVFLPEIHLLLGPTARGIVDDQDTAESIAATLRAEGYHAHPAREPFAGEEDDEDHAWSVTTDAPTFRLDLLLDDHDGWLDIAADPSPSASPLDLPTAPKRHHRPPH